MILRSGKYQGYTLESVVMIDPGYIRWVRENRPEMLIERRKPQKIQKVELTEEELEQKQAYKNLPRESWDSAF